MPENEPENHVVAPSVQHPVVPRHGATHFRLRRSGVPCIWEYGGVSLEIHPIEDFDKDVIQSRWGFDRDYRVIFLKEKNPGSRHPLGAEIKFGLIGDTAPQTPVRSDLFEQGYVPGPDNSLAPYNPSTGTSHTPESQLHSTLGILQALRGISQEDTRLQVESQRIASAEALASTRESYKATLEIVGMLFKERSAPPPPQIPGELTVLLQKIVSKQEEIEKKIASFEESPEEPEYEDPSPHEQLMKDIEKNGLSAILGYLKKESISSFIDALPTIKERFPALLEMIAPMLQSKIQEAFGGAAQASSPAPMVPFQSVPISVG